MEIRPIVSALLRNKVAPVLVALQIAISLAILSNALYIVNLRLTSASRPSGLSDEKSTFYTRVGSNRTLSTEDKLNQEQHFFQTIAAVPGVASVADISEMPLALDGHISSVSSDPEQVKPTADATTYDSGHSVIKTFGLNLIAGRDFNEADIEDVNPELPYKDASHVIITAALAARLFPGQASVIGKSFFWGTGSDSRSSQVIGVVERLQTPGASNNEEGEYSVLTPKRRRDSSPVFAIRAEPGQRDRVIAEVEASLRKSDNAPLRIKTHTVENDRKIRYGTEMTMAWMLIVVSVLLIIITASGIVGMTSLWVNQRRKYIGVRRALGARKIDILRYFITENVIIGCAGVVSGSLLAIGLNQFLVSQLELTKIPLPYIGYGAAMFLLLGLGAAYAPSWRAASISPAVATRST
jgi:putative ABC transport system permease protein